MSEKKDVVLITGAAGWMGQHAVRLALQKFRRVIAWDVQMPKDTHPDVSFHQVDLTQPKQINEAARQFQDMDDLKVVWHAAGLFNYAASRDLLFKVNHQGTANLIKHLALPLHRGNRLGSFVYWSGATVYGAFDFPLPATEESPMRPINDYGESKLRSEEILLSLARETQFPAVILQITGAYGPGMDPSRPYGMGILFKLFWEGRLQNLPLAGSVVRRASLVHVEDIMRAAYFLSYTPQAYGQRYLVTDDGRYNALEISKFLGKELHNPFIPVPLPMSVFKLLTWMIERNRKRYNINPLIDAGLAQMMMLNTHASNRKLLALDPNILKYRDSLVGLKAAIDDMKKEGFLR